MGDTWVTPEQAEKFHAEYLVNAERDRRNNMWINRLKRWITSLIGGKDVR